MIMSAMPWWAIIYLALFVVFSIVADGLSESDGSNRMHWFADLVTGAIFAILFAGFWVSPIYFALGILAPVLFMLAVAWEVYSGPGDLRQIWTDKELSRKERIGLTVIPPLLVWPLYVIAGIGVFRFYTCA